MSDMETKMMRLEQKLTDHIDACEGQFEEGQVQFKELSHAVSANNDSIQECIGCLTECSKNIKDLSENTKDIVQAWNDVQGTARIGKNVQGFLISIAKWPLIGAGLYTLGTWVLKISDINIPPPQ